MIEERAVMRGITLVTRGNWLLGEERFLTELSSIPIRHETRDEIDQNLAVRPRLCDMNQEHQEVCASYSVCKSFWKVTVSKSCGSTCTCRRTHEKAEHCLAEAGMFNGP